MTKTTGRELTLQARTLSTGKISEIQTLRSSKLIFSTPCSNNMDVPRKSPILA